MRWWAGVSWLVPHGEVVDVVLRAQLSIRARGRKIDTLLIILRRKNIGVRVTPGIARDIFHVRSSPAAGVARIRRELLQLAGIAAGIQLQCVECDLQRKDVRLRRSL